MSPWRKLGIAGAALAALGLLYTGAWFYIADRLAHGIDRWAAERRAEGWIAQYDAVSVKGFPLAWRARITAPRLVQQVREPGFFWTGPSLDLRWVPWRARIVAFRSVGGHRLGFGPMAATRPAQLDLADARGHLGFGDDGGLQLLSLRLDGVTLAPPDGDRIRLNRLVGTLDTAPDLSSRSTPEEAHLEPSLRIDGELFGLTLPATPRPALGRTIGHIALRGAVMGAIPAAEPREALDRWRRDGGTVEIEQLDIGWSALTLRADGTASLDADLQPIGAMTARISGYSETADALVAAGLLKPGEALVVKFALGALAKPPAAGGKPVIEVPIAAQDGFLYVGPVKLLPLPPVRWD